MKKAMKCMAGILVLTLAFAQVTPVSAFAEEAIAATDAEQTIYTGTCGAEGDNITWTYDTTTQTMTFSGTGSMGLERYAITTDLMPWRQGDVASVYNAKNVVFEEGITDLGYLSDNTVFGADVDEYTLTVPDSAEKWDWIYRTIRKTMSYAQYGSRFYYSLMHQLKDGGFSIGEHFTSTGTSENPIVPAQGTAKNGMTWDYSYDTLTLTIGGTDTIPSALWDDEEGIDSIAYAATTIIIDRDFIAPDDVKTGRLEKYQYINELLNIEDVDIYCYKDSAFGKLYEERTAYYDEEFPPFTMYDKIHYIENANCGDMNTDGVVDLLDAIYFGKYLAGLIQPSDVQLAATDCNGNGVTGEEADLSVLMKFLVGSITDLPYTGE